MYSPPVYTSVGEDKRSCQECVPDMPPAAPSAPSSCRIIHGDFHYRDSRHLHLLRDLSFQQNAILSGGILPIFPPTSFRHMPAVAKTWKWRETRLKDESAMTKQEVEKKCRGIQSQRTAFQYANRIRRRGLSHSRMLGSAQRPETRGSGVGARMRRRASSEEADRKGNRGKESSSASSRQWRGCWSHIHTKPPGVLNKENVVGSGYRKEA